MATSANMTTCLIRSMPQSPPAVFDCVTLLSFMEEAVWDRWCNAHVKACLSEFYKDLAFTTLDSPKVEVQRMVDTEYRRICKYSHRVLKFIRHINSFYYHELAILTSERPMFSTTSSLQADAIGGCYRSFEEYGTVGWVFGWDPTTGKDNGHDALANYALLNSCLRNIPSDVVRMVVVGFGLYDPYHFNREWNDYPKLSPGGLIEVGVENMAQLKELVFMDSPRALSYILPCLNFSHRRRPPPPRISLIVLDNDPTFLTTEFHQLLTWITNPKSLLLHPDRGMWWKISREGEVYTSAEDSLFISTMSFILELYAPEAATSVEPWARIEILVHFQALDRHRQAKFVEVFEDFLPRMCHVWRASW